MKGQKPPDECVWCGARITGWSMWKRHMKLHPKETRRRACEECGQVFTIGPAYLRHVATIHAPEPEYSDRRFFQKVKQDHDTGCWMWTGTLTHHGYGQFALRGPYPSKRVSAYRWAYERLVGPIPEGLELDHLCRVPACVNPAHLEPVTKDENMRRGVEALTAIGSPCPVCDFVAELPGALASHVRHKHPAIYRPKTRRINGRVQLVTAVSRAGDGT